MFGSVKKHFRHLIVQDLLCLEVQFGAFLLVRIAPYFFDQPVHFRISERAPVVACRAEALGVIVLIKIVPAGVLTEAEKGRFEAAGLGFFGQLLDIQGDDFDVYAAGPCRLFDTFRELFGYRARGGGNGFDRQRRSAAVDHFIHDAVVVGVGPAGFGEQFPGLLYVVLVGLDVFGVIRFDRIDGADQAFAHTLLHGIEQVIVVDQMGKGLTDLYIGEFGIAQVEQPTIVLEGEPGFEVVIGRQEGVFLNDYSGTRIRDAEDKFVYGITTRHWDSIREGFADPEFRLVSARKSIRILQNQPKRTPGIGLRAWGTGASAEVNVHISIAGETKPWREIFDRIVQNSLGDIIEAINRKKTEVVHDPEI